jgi:hypothetical protein
MTVNLGVIDGLVKLLKSAYVLGYEDGEYDGYNSSYMTEHPDELKCDPEKVCTLIKGSVEVKI